MDNWWDQLDPETREYCLYDNARAARGHMTDANFKWFLMGSINAGSQIIFQLCVWMLGQAFDLPRQLQIVTAHLPFTVGIGRVNIFYFLMETYGEPISTYAREKELYLTNSNINMMDALIWCGCIEYTAKFKSYVGRIQAPVHVWPTTLERFIQV